MTNAKPTKSVQSAPANSMTLLPEFAKTPKRGRDSKRPFVEPKALMSYALENGGRIDLTNTSVIQELENRGLKPARISSAAWACRKFFGLDVKSERTGRKVTALIVPVTA